VTVVGSDNFADAPLLEVGTSSAYTPNAGYGIETGEPTAWGGKTAWWKVVPTVEEFHWIDVLYSTGSTRAWVYRQDGSGIDDLFLVSNPGADTQGGWTAGAGTTYYIRLDSDGSDVSYVASVGVTTYDEYTERRTIHGPAPEDATFPWNVREDYFIPGNTFSPIEDEWPAHYYGLVDEHVMGAPGGTAVMHVQAFADDVVADSLTVRGVDWYGSSGGHPTLVFSSTSAGGDAVDDPPAGYELARARVFVTAGSSDGPPIPADPDGDVPQVRLSGEFDSGPVRHVDEFGSPAGDVTFGSSATEVEFWMPTGFDAFTALDDYHAGELVFQLQPNLSGSGPDPEPPYPAGSWFVYAVEIEFIFQSEDALPYEPPPPPLAVTYVRQFPTSHAGTWGGSPRIYPPPKVQRIIGGHT
jgi:hypothetical protein